MMQRLAHISFAVLLVCSAGLLSCTKDFPKQEAGTISIHSEVKSNGDSGSGAVSEMPVFIFWNYGDWLNQTTNPQPRFVANPSGKIDDYKSPAGPYDTGELYPDGNLRVIATGYAPSTLAPTTLPDGNLDYELLQLPSGQDNLATTDVLTSAEPVVASSSLPFDREGGEPLQFMHAQSRVCFKAKLSDSMGKFVKNVRITIGAGAVGNQVRWSRSTFTYSSESAQSSTSTYTISQQGDDQLSKEKTIDIGYAYIVPGLTAVPVTITVDMSDDVQFTSYEEVERDAGLAFSITRTPEELAAGVNSNTLYANESYTFTLSFKELGIELTGSKCPWESGGYLTVPVYPVGSSSGN